MQVSSIEIPESLWTLAENAHMKSQLEDKIRTGNYKEAMRVVRLEGEAVAEDLNSKRRFVQDQLYAFQAEVKVSEQSLEDEHFLHDLQQLYKALIQVFGSPV